MSPLAGVPHTAICGSCFEPWPCLHEKQRGNRSQRARRAREACHRCGKPVTGMRVEVKNGGLLGEDVGYHGRQGACRRAGLDHLARALDEATEPLLRLELEREHTRLDEEQRLGRAEREARRLMKGGGSIVRTEELPDRLVTWVKLDLVEEEQRTEWRLGANVSDALALFAASRQVARRDGTTGTRTAA